MGATFSSQKEEEQQESNSSSSRSMTTKENSSNTETEESERTENNNKMEDNKGSSGENNTVNKAIPQEEVKEPEIVRKNVGVCSTFDEFRAILQWFIFLVGSPVAADH